MVCKQCGITLSKSSKRDGFCSQQCQINHLQAVPTTVPTCNYCLEKFTAYRKTAKFCSDSCRVNAHNKRPYDRFFILKKGKKFKLQLVERRVPDVQYAEIESPLSRFIIVKYGTEWQESPSKLLEIITLALDI